MPLVLGVDSSTQSTKVEVRDADSGALVASGRAPHPPTTPPRSEHDPNVWWTALIDAIAQTGQRQIAALSVAGQQHGMVVTDDAGAVLRPAKLWNDTESAPQAAGMVGKIGAERWASMVGVVPVAAITVTKLAWLAAHERAVFDRIGHVLLPHDWITFRLTGRMVTDRGDASGTGYFSAAQDRWRPEVLARIDPSVSEARWLERLPTVLGPSERADWLSAAVPELLGLRGRPIVAAGTGDNMAAALGIGLRPGHTAVSIGTSGTVFSVSTRPVADPTGAVAGFADATGRFLPLVCTNNATKVTEAVARLLGTDAAGAGRLALEAPAGAGGLVLLPYLDGERTPNRPDATGALQGLRSDVTREQLARAAFEGVVCSLLDAVDALSDAGVQLSDAPLQLVGGGARSPAYRQILADLSGRPVVTPKGEEHVAKGACVQAAAALTGRRPEEVIEAWGLGSGAVTEPGAVDPAPVRAAYAAARDR
jgi:xylulokinase